MCPQKGLLNYKSTLFAQCIFFGLRRPYTLYISHNSLLITVQMYVMHCTNTFHQNMAIMCLLLRHRLFQSQCWQESTACYSVFPSCVLFGFLLPGKYFVCGQQPDMANLGPNVGPSVQGDLKEVVGFLVGCDLRKHTNYLVFV